MTDEKAREDFMNDVYNTLDFLPTNNEANRIIDSFDRVTSELEQQPCENWYDVPSNEMTLEQARQAVKDLRKKLAEYLEQQPCEDCVSRQAILDIIMPYCQDDDGSVENTGDLRNALDDIESLSPVAPKKKSEYEHDHEVVKAYNDGQANILDKIRAEIKKESEVKTLQLHWGEAMGLNKAIDIIDKYRGE